MCSTHMIHHFMYNPFWSKWASIKLLYTPTCNWSLNEQTKNFWYIKFLGKWVLQFVCFDILKQCIILWSFKKTEVTLKFKSSDNLKCLFHQGQSTALSLMIPPRTCKHETFSQKVNDITYPNLHYMSLFQWITLLILSSKIVALL